MTSPPAIFRDLVIVGALAPEGVPRGPAGDVRAFDASTGRERWRFHTVPRPGEFGHDTWPADGWQRRTGANVWSSMSVDSRARAGLPAHWIAVVRLLRRRSPRREPVRHFARRARCRDRPAPLARAARAPRPLGLRSAGATNPRRHSPRRPPDPGCRPGDEDGTGVRLRSNDRRTSLRVDERPVPASDVPGEVASPTQPFPRKPTPFSRIDAVTRADLTDVTPESRRECEALFAQVKSGGLYTPRRARPDAVVSRDHGRRDVVGRRLRSGQRLLVVNTNEIGAIGQMAPAPRPTLPAMDAHRPHQRVRSFLGQPAVAVSASTVGSAACGRPLERRESRGRCRSEMSRRWRLAGSPAPAHRISEAPSSPTAGLAFIGGAGDSRIPRFRSALGTRTLARRPPRQRSRDAHQLPRRQSGRQFIFIAAAWRRALFEGDFRRICVPAFAALRPDSR